MRQCVQPVPYWIKPAPKTERPPVANAQRKQPGQQARIANVRAKLQRVRVWYESACAPGEVPQVCVNDHGQALVIGATVEQVLNGDVAVLVE